jgi:hypothetical protein
VYDGSLWALALAVAAVPFGYIALFAVAAGLLLLTVTYVVSRFRRAPVRLLDYRPGEFAVVLTAAAVFVLPMYVTAFMLVLVVAGAAERLFR